jgi:nucleoside-diphosphate-sugar epimerase
MRRALVTGAAGFIGSNLCERLVNDGWFVVGVDDLSNGHTEFMPDEGMSFMKADFSSVTVLEWIKEHGFDVVFHLAAVPRVSYSVEHPLETNDTNVSKTLKLMDACRGNVKRFVFSSSSSVYGGADVLPTPETAPKNPKSPYALQKSIIEDYLSLYSELYDFESACLRYFNVFGKNQLGGSPYATAVASWLTNIKQGKPLRSDGDGSQSRDMCYVDNVVQANVLAANFQGKLNAGCFNVACGDRVSNKEILNFLLKRYPDAQVVNATWRPGDVMHTQADVTKAQNVLGYSNPVSFWEGLERTIEWFDSSPLVSKLVVKV